MINIIIENTNVRQSLIVGGLSVDKQIRVLKKKKPHILVGTPGRLHELLNNQFIQFSNLKYLVIDEADRMIELGHYVELDEILNKIFNPKVEEFFEHDFHEIEKSLSKKKSKQDFFIVQQGKKVKLNFDMHSFQTDKLFEIPSDLFTIYDPNQEKKKNKKSK